MAETVKSSETVDAGGTQVGVATDSGTKYGNTNHDAATATATNVTTVEEAQRMQAEAMRAAAQAAESAVPQARQTVGGAVMGMATILPDGNIAYSNVGDTLVYVAVVENGRVTGGRILSVPQHSSNLTPNVIDYNLSPGHTQEAIAHMYQGTADFSAEINRGATLVVMSATDGFTETFPDFKRPEYSTRIAEIQSRINIDFKTVGAQTFFDIARDSKDPQVKKLMGELETIANKDVARKTSGIVDNLNATVEQQFARGAPSPEALAKKLVDQPYFYNGRDHIDNTTGVVSIVNRESLAQASASPTQIIADGNYKEGKTVANAAADAAEKSASNFTPGRAAKREREKEKPAAQEAAPAAAEGAPQSRCEALEQEINQHLGDGRTVSVSYNGKTGEYEIATRKGVIVAGEDLAFLRRDGGSVGTAKGASEKMGIAADALADNISGRLNAIPDIERPGLLGRLFGSRSTSATSSPGPGTSTSPEASAGATMVLSSASRDAAAANCRAMEESINTVLEDQGRAARVQITYDEKSRAYLIGTKGGVVSESEVAILTQDGRVPNLAGDATKMVIPEANVSTIQEAALGLKKLEYVPEQGMIGKIAEHLPRWVRPAGHLAKGVVGVGAAVAMAESVFATSEAQAAEARHEITPEQLKTLIAAYDATVPLSLGGIGADNAIQKINTELLASGIPQHLLPATMMKGGQELAQLAAEHSPAYAAMLDDNRWAGEMGALKLVLASKSDDPDAAITMLNEIRETDPKTAATIAVAMRENPSQAENILLAYQQAKQQGVTAVAGANPQPATEPHPPASTPVAVNEQAAGYVQG